MAVLVGGRRGHKRSDPLARTLRSVTVKALLMLFSSDTSCPRVGRGGSGDGATCSNHVPSSVHALACPASPAALGAAGSGVFEVDGRAEVPDFFLGAMVDGVVEDEDGDEDDTLRMLLGSRKGSPYLACQRCRGMSAATYGTRRPLAGSAGGRRVAQRSDQWAAARQRAHQQFTQVRAAVRRKTLLLLWWID